MGREKGNRTPFLDRFVPGMRITRRGFLGVLAAVPALAPLAKLAGAAPVQAVGKLGVINDVVYHGSAGSSFAAPSTALKRALSAAVARGFAKGQDKMIMGVLSKRLGPSDLI